MPSWADVVRNDPRLSLSPPAVTTISSSSTTADFLALYDRCISSGLKTRINISNLAGAEEITLTCHILTCFTSACRRCRRGRPHRRGPAVSAASPTRTSLPPTRSAPSPTWPEPPPPVPPAPEPSPPESPPTPSPPPAKRTRKVAKWRCVVELLRGEGVKDDFYVLPPVPMPPPARSPLPPSPTPTVSPITEQSLCFPDLPQLLALQPVSTPDHSAPAPAPSTIFSPPIPQGLPSSPPLAALVISTPTSQAPAPSTISSPPTASGPTPSAAPERSSTTPATSEQPPPPPWRKGYVFSTDPDIIICWYCCKRHYNY